MINSSILLCFLLVACHFSDPAESITASPTPVITSKIYPPNSWQYYLQHLPVHKGLVKDYTGKTIRNQDKHFAIVDLDVGNKDLQQCADALMRLRAEYLFARNRADEIAFHFVNGSKYTFSNFCKGYEPVIRNNTTSFIRRSPKPVTHASLRTYLDIVYSYASTISLAKELKDADKLETGTIIIKPGSPGHCSIIVDEGTTAQGKIVFKLAEGYTPAQNIYILANPFSPTLNPWYELNGGVIETSSYVFMSYKLKKFE